MKTLAQRKSFKIIKRPSTIWNLLEDIYSDPERLNSLLESLSELLESLL